MATYTPSDVTNDYTSPNTRSSNQPGIDEQHSPTAGGCRNSLAGILQQLSSGCSYGAFAWTISNPANGFVDCQISCKDTHVRSTLAKSLAESGFRDDSKIRESSRSDSKVGLKKITLSVRSDTLIIVSQKTKTSGFHTSQVPSHTQQSSQEESLKCDTNKILNTSEISNQQQSFLHHFTQSPKSNTKIPKCNMNPFTSQAAAQSPQAAAQSPLSEEDRLACRPFDLRLNKEIAANHSEQNLIFRGKDIPQNKLRNCLQVAIKSIPQSCKLTSKPEIAAEKQKAKQKTPSTVVFIKGLNLADVSMEGIANLFECFGHVEIVMYHLKRQYTLVKYSTRTEAKVCIKEMYGKEICPGKGHLLLHYSEFKDICPKFYSNEKTYYIPDVSSRYTAQPQKVGRLSRSLLITVHSHEDNKTLDQSRVTSALQKLFKTQPQLTRVQDEYIVEMPSIKSSISFVLENNFKELIGGEAFIALTFAPRHTT